MVNVCNKAGYDSKIAASNDAKFILSQKRARKSAKSGNKLRPYKCGNCGMWHLTSMSKPLAKKLLRNN